jgi:hypothetical protein
MAQPDFTAPTLRVTPPKPRMTVYYALLIVALVCMLVACLFMYLEVRRFGGFGTVPKSISALEQRMDAVFGLASTSASHTPFSIG